MHQPILLPVTRRKKTPAEMKESLKQFDRISRQETAKSMRNCFERIAALGHGRVPAKYKWKSPRITTTVLLPAVKKLNATRPEPKRVHLSAAERRKSHQRGQIKAAKRRRIQAAETREFQKIIANAIERANAFGDRRRLPARYKPKYGKTRTVTSVAKLFHAAQARLLARLI